MAIKNVIAKIEVWHQVSANYDAAKQTHIKTFSPNTTAEEIVEWATTLATSQLGCGDLVLLAEKEVPDAKGEKGEPSFEVKEANDA